MNKRLIINYIITIVLFVLFAVLAVLLVTVDVKPLGAESTNIGLAAINVNIFNSIGVSGGWKTVTDVFIIAALCVAAAFFVYGAVLLIRNKSIKKVDYKILLLGIIYILLAAFYVLFEFVIVNYRPLVTADGLEASFPSTHTMLVVGIMASAAAAVNYLFKRRAFIITADIIAALVIAVTAVGRLMAGVHWFTDILGGLILGAALSMLYYTVIANIESRKSNG